MLAFNKAIELAVEYSASPPEDFVDQAGSAGRSAVETGNQPAGSTGFFYSPPPPPGDGANYENGNKPSDHHGSQLRVLAYSCLALAAAAPTWEGDERRR